MANIISHAWSTCMGYLYARMIPYLTKAGVRVIAPDLVGCRNQMTGLTRRLFISKSSRLDGLLA